MWVCCATECVFNIFSFLRSPGKRNAPNLDALMLTCHVSFSLWARPDIQAFEKGEGHINPNFSNLSRLLRIAKVSCYGILRCSRSAFRPLVGALHCRNGCSRIQLAQDKLGYACRSATPTLFILNRTEEYSSEEISLNLNFASFINLNLCHSKVR